MFAESALDDPSDLRIGELSLSSGAELDYDARAYISLHRASLPDASVCAPAMRERRGSALENGMRLPPYLAPAAFNLQFAAPSAPDYDPYVRRASDERSHEFGSGAVFDSTRISTDELLRMQEQRIFAAHDDSEAMRSLGCEWT